MHADDVNRWVARPVMGGLLSALLIVGPVAAGMLAGILARVGLPSAGLFGIPRWVFAGTVGMIVVWVCQLGARRLMPLSWLLRIGMLFPADAPSRLDIARRAARDLDPDVLLARPAFGSELELAQRNAEVVLTLVSALEKHDRRTRGHSERTRVYTDMLAEQLGLPRDDRDRLRWASLLHDIGKLEVDEAILNKAGRPTEREWEQLRRHPEAGYRLLEPLHRWLGEWAASVLHHHERWDGGGYPAGLVAEEIPYGARIIAVTDAYDVMTSARSYKRPGSPRAAREELVACAGSQFDPAVVRAFLMLPLPKLRWAFGPLAWLSQLPVAREAVHLGGVVPAAASSAAANLPAAAGAATVVAGVTLAPTVASALAPDLAESVFGDDADRRVAVAAVAGEPAPIELEVRSGLTDLEVVTPPGSGDTPTSASPASVSSAPAAEAVADPGPDDRAETPGATPAPHRPAATEPAPSAPSPPSSSEPKAPEPTTPPTSTPPAPAPDRSTPATPAPSPVPPVAEPGTPEQPDQPRRPRGSWSSDDSDDSDDSADSAPSWGSNDSD